MMFNLVPNHLSGMSRMVGFNDAPALLDFCVQRSFIHREDWLSTPEQARAALEREADAKRLVRELVRAKLLTQYQADRIEAGTIHGMLLGSYRVLDRLGAGGMGVVFVAEHIHLRRLAAIKMLPLYGGAESGGPLLTRFFNEIRIIAQLQHPNIVWALDTGEIAGETPESPVLYYHVMEYVPGKDLENLVRANGPLPIAHACDLAYQIASALVEANKHNLVHRDIKPSNIIVTPEGQAKLLDFGLARSLSNRHTQQGVVLGTADYLAPEQARDASGVDIRADVYSLGGTLFWALTGKVPFPSDASLQHQIMTRLTHPPPRVSRLLAQAPAELDGVIARMMATDPNDRFASPQAVMRALLPLLKTQSGELIYLNLPETGHEAGLAANHHADAPTASKRRVLIVDDEGVMRDVARHSLGSEGLECAEAADGEQALEMLAAKAFDLVLLDVELPGIRGDEVLRRLRENPPCPNLKIIIASAWATVEEMSNLLIAGADDFLVKPFSIFQLIARVKSALRLKDAQDRTDSLAQSLLNLNQKLEQNLRSRDSDLIDARNGLTLAIAELVTYRGVETSAHLTRIQRYARILAESAAKHPYFGGKLDANVIQLLESTAPLHDVGMIGLPDYIFLKPGRLADDERVLMRTHTTLGADILQKVARQQGFAVAFMQMAIDITRHHHERWDGKGYPDHLRGDDIPLPARIVSIADVYDALRSRRPHKPALSHVAAIEVLTDCSHGQFDPTLLQIFHGCADAFEQVFRTHPN